MNRPVTEIRAELEREREELVESAETLRAEVDRRMDVRRQLREHPVARVALIVAGVLTMLLVLALMVAAVRAITGLFGLRD